MSILIKKAGILTTVQDLGRNNFRRFGINQNGAMDKIAVRLINSLLGNDENEAVLEMHFPAPEILFEEPAVFALGGADLSAKLNGEPAGSWRICFAEQGSTLKFEQKEFGNRAYLAIKGGFRIKKWLGSASTNLKAKIGGFEGRKLQINDRISFNQIPEPKSKIPNRKVSNSLIPFYSKFPTVRVIVGAEFELLTPNSREILLNENFTITQNSDRMGFRLQGEPLFLRTRKELVSSAVNFGTIQLLPDGQMIVLMADHQTSGGYPRLANLISTDLPLLAQLGTNDKAAFHLISIGEAENVAVDFEKNLNLLKIAAKFL
ncbi:MAG TPA: biotin-dependent carboxyltransferase family protein [Pyrinomonadaceae bacterium]|nr:biotin-dependent carboxyltransferase family protein [Pyrinomonadaceae bacterium]